MFSIQLSFSKSVTHSLALIILKLCRSVAVETWHFCQTSAENPGYTKLHKQELHWFCTLCIMMIDTTITKSMKSTINDCDCSSENWNICWASSKLSCMPSFLRAARASYMDISYLLCKRKAAATLVSIGVSSPARVKRLLQMICYRQISAIPAKQCRGVNRSMTISWWCQSHRYLETLQGYHHTSVP